MDDSPLMRFVERIGDRDRQDFADGERVPLETLGGRFTFHMLVTRQSTSLPLVV